MDVKPVKMRGRLRGDSLDVKCLMPHPMETGVRKDFDGNPIPAHFIETVSCSHNDELVITAQLGPSVSRDPYFSFTVHGVAAGDRIEISWVDNRGNSSSGELIVRDR